MLAVRFKGASWELDGHDVNSVVDEELPLSRGVVDGG